MKDDSIVEEIRRIRSAHAARYGNDLDRIFFAIKEEEKKYAARLVNREPIMQRTRNIGEHGQTKAYQGAALDSASLRQ